MDYCLSKKTLSKVEWRTIPELTTVLSKLESSILFSSLDFSLEFYTPIGYLFKKKHSTEGLFDSCLLVPYLSCV